MFKLQTDKGEILISDAVLSNITGAAATSCYGVKGMAYRSMTDGIVHLLRGEAMSKGVHITQHDEGDISIELHIIVEHGVNMVAISREIISQVRYLVSKNTGARIRSVDVCVDSITM
ncbi:MAG: Asp23/Gls24 family envelope stress response protein [Oscillospiraceae bacterium]|nr:Asp23/Gls24 family envelope stress response protein [Oscillospiraceae bacterium]